MGGSLGWKRRQTERLKQRKIRKEDVERRGKKRVNIIQRKYIDMRRGQLRNEMKTRIYERALEEKSCESITA
jgi:hypothetical protein